MTLYVRHSLDRRPVILLDCDGILADFIGGVLPLIHRVTGRQAAREQITAFDFAASLGLNPDEAAAVKRAIGCSDRFASTLEAYPGAIEGVGTLREVADVYIVTSPWNSNPTWTHDRETWLRRHFGIPHSHVIHGSAKHLVRGDVFVDDKTETVVAWQAAHPSGRALRWSTPHNARDAYGGSSTNDWNVVRELAIGAAR